MIFGNSSMENYSKDAKMSIQPRSAEVMEVTSSVPQQSMADERSVTGSD